MLLALPTLKKMHFWKCENIWGEKNTEHLLTLVMRSYIKRIFIKTRARWTCRVLATLTTLRDTALPSNQQHSSPLVRPSNHSNKQRPPLHCQFNVYKCMAVKPLKLYSASKADPLLSSSNPLYLPTHAAQPSRRKALPPTVAFNRCFMAALSMFSGGLPF